MNTKSMKKQEMKKEKMVATKDESGARRILNFLMKPFSKKAKNNEKTIYPLF
jgi:hypothetical protein